VEARARCDVAMQCDDFPVSGVNYFSLRVDSSLLLPDAARCLMKNVTRPFERDEWQIERATERGNKTGLIEAVEARYRAAGRDEKKGFLTNSSR